MEVFEAVRTVLAVRKYIKKSIPEESILKILEAGRLTGSARNRQPWHFILVQKRETLQELSRLTRSGPFIADAELAIAVAIEKTDFAVSDASRAIQSMILTAWSEGIVSNWAGFLGQRDSQKLLGIPGHLDLLAILAFGYPTFSNFYGKKNRKSLAEIAHSERFGNPYVK
jgi:nitroreductase